MEITIRVKSDVVSLGRAPVSNVQCNELTEGTDYEVDIKGGRIIPLKDLKNIQYTFTFDWIDPNKVVVEKTWKDDVELKKIIDKAKIDGRLDLVDKYPE